jgi:hypothetical protein
MKYDALRYRAGSGLVWASATIQCALISNYTFNTTHGTLAQILASGGVLGEYALLADKSVSPSGQALSAAVTLADVPAGTYDIVLFLDVDGVAANWVPLVNYPDEVIVAVEEDVVVYPDEADISPTGVWFSF